MQTKRKRASSPVLPTNKRQKTGQDTQTRNLSSENASSGRTTRRQTLSAVTSTVTPQRPGDVALSLVQRASLKKQYGRKARSARGSLVGSGPASVEGEDSEIESSGDVPLSTTSKVEEKLTKKSSKGITRTPQDILSISTPSKPGVSRPTRSTSTLLFGQNLDSTQYKLPSLIPGRSPQLLLSKPPPNGAIKEMLRRRRSANSNVQHETDSDSDPAITEDESQPTPCRPRRGLKDLKTPTKNGKAGALLLSAKYTTPKHVESSSPVKKLRAKIEAIDIEKTPHRPPARPKKGRSSYTATVKSAPALDLSKSDTSSIRAIEDALNTAVSSTPVPDTETEGSGTEGELTPASARVFDASSPLVLPDDMEDELEDDGDGKLVLDEAMIPEQPNSPSKLPLHKALPVYLHPFVEKQKKVIMKTLHSPPYIDISPISLGEKATQEASSFEQLTEILKGTCERGEGNSCLLLGSRGSGKSLLLKKTLENYHGDPIVVRLSGHTQTTDRLAMQEIAYQLSHQTDTVLSIPEEEMEANNEEGDGGVDFSPPAAYLPTLISQLTSLKKPVVVALDAFDLFAAHPRQALLYCLLDTVQSCRAGDGRNGLLVIGSTCVVNCVNLLEKRVKSRFSHRILKVTNPSTLDEYIDVAKKLLGTSLDPKEYAKNKAERKHLAEWNDYWTTTIEHFMTQKSTRSAFIEIFGLRRDIGNLIRVLLPLVMELGPSRPYLSTSLLTSSEASQLPSSYDFMHRLPQASMWILVALYHWDTAGHDIVNLKMVLDSVGKATTFQDGVRLVVSTPRDSRAISSTAMSPAILQTSFEELVRLKVLQPINAASSNLKQSQEFVKYKCMVDRESIRRTVEKNGTTAVKNWLVTPGVTTA
ncbi:hypothetical protein CPB86DRAFT_746443 [Serendipita vermifera]|nr:hypothetical protein CPB86DRAFT_746443 [Serendipita vermifera]